MAMNFPKDLATYLAANAAELTLGTNLFYNTKVKDNVVVPNLSAFIYSTKPRPPVRCFSNSNEIRYPKAIILVRSNIEGSIDGDELEDAQILTEIIYSTLQSADISGYQDIKFLGSDFEQGAKDDDNRHLFMATIEGFRNRTP